MGFDMGLYHPYRLSTAPHSTPPEVDEQKWGETNAGDRKVRGNNLEGCMQFEVGCIFVAPKIKGCEARVLRASWNSSV